MCRVLHLSESGYYRWLRNRKKRQLLAVKINAILAKHPDNRNYGVDRVCLALEQDGVDVSRRTVYRVMKEKGWLHPKRVPHGITKAATGAQEQENLLKQDFSARRPLEKFLTDITEVQYADDKRYVSPVMDCFSGEIVTLEMQDNMKKELCIDTVRQLGRIYSSLKGRDVLLRSRESIHQRGFSRRAVSLRHGTEPPRHRTLLRQCTDGELFCQAQEREDLSDRGIQAAERTGQNDHFSLYFYLLQLHQGLYTQPAWTATCEVPGMGAGAAGSLTGAAELFRFCVFSDCTFLDISIRKVSITLCSRNSNRIGLALRLFCFNDDSFLQNIFFLKHFIPADK